MCTHGVPADAVLDEGVPEPEGSGSKGVGYGRVDRLVVASVIASGQQLQLKNV